MPIKRNVATPSSHPQWYNDVTPAPSPVVVVDFESTCPSCKMPFDKGKKRKLIDVCGHGRCYSCMFSNEKCPLCRMNNTNATSKCMTMAPLDAHSSSTLVTKERAKLSKTNTGAHVRQSSDSGVSLLTHTRPKLKTNGHFTPFMQARQESVAFQRESSPLEDDFCSEDAMSTSLPPRQTPPSPRQRHVAWPHRKQRSSNATAHHPSAFSVFQSWPAEMLRKIRSLWSLDDEAGLDPPPPPAESARHDLFMRLGLLLGDRDQSQSPIQRLSGRTGAGNGKIPQSCASLSSLTSSDANTSASNSTSPLSTLTASSEADRLTSNMSGFRSSRDPSSESMASLMSSSTGTTGTSMTSGSGSPMSTLPRRHSITTTAPDQVENLNLFGKKRSSPHPLSRTKPTKLPLELTELSDYSASHIELKPLFFEVPQAAKSSIFIGRQWLFKEIEEVLNSSRRNSRGITITGGIGSGKTSVILQLVEHSCFGRKKDEPLYCEIYDSRNPVNLSGSRASLSNSRWSLNQPCHRMRNLGARVVAYHFCQADNNVTCLVPEFVHSMAAQMCQAPQLAAYRELLLNEPRYQAILSPKECISNPSYALLKGIVEPLIALHQYGKLGNDICILVVDSLNEAEFHRPDHGETIASFLVKHIYHFPQWLRVIVTVRTALQDITKWLPFHRLSLDDMTNENVQSDLFDYITHRINQSVDLRANVTFNGKLESCSTGRFTNHLLQLSKGCFLYAKLTLDHIERGHLVMKSISYKVLPINLSEVFLLHFNLRFPTTQSFHKVSVILCAALASLYPMNILEIFHTINAGQIGWYISWEDFLQRLDSLSDFLVQRQDGTYMFFHPSFREWLIHRTENETKKFLCDPRSGHANIAFRLTRLEAPLSSEKTGELGHHILKAHIYKNVSRQMGFLSRDVQALWITIASSDVSSALVVHRNVINPNIKVSRLLLLAGANANERTGFFNDAPMLALASREGVKEMVLMLLEFGADVNGVAKNGASVLCLACAGGHLEIVKMLVSHGALMHLTDTEGYCAVVYAALHGHLPVVTWLLQCDWTLAIMNGLSRTVAAQQALVMAASRGHTLVCEYLLSVPEVDINISDTVSKETALTAAASNGHKDTTVFLLRRGASVANINAHLAPPLLCAVREGQEEIASLLLQHHAGVDQVDGCGRTALMMSVCEGNTSLMELLLTRGASVMKADNEGLTALCWACLKGQYNAVQKLLDHGANIHHTDCTGRTPLNLAAFHGEPNVVQLLLDRGATVEHVDHNGMRPLDRAIGCKNTAAVICFLKRGAKLGPATWTMAADKPDIMMILLNKLFEDGNLLYKKNRLKDAAYRFQYALKKFPTDTVGEEARPFQQLKVNLLLSLSRCRRKSLDFDAAVDLATKALEVNPKSYEAYYARARARRDLGQNKLAVEDLTEAIKLSPEHRELRRLLQHIQEDIKDSSGKLSADNGRQSLNTYLSTNTNGSLPGGPESDVTILPSVQSLAFPSLSQRLSTCSASAVQTEDGL